MARYLGTHKVLMSSANYEAESLAIFAAFTTSPDDTRKGHINTCVAALKTAGVWAKIDFLHVYAAANSQAALINWKNPGTFDGTAVSAPTFTTDRGFTGDGSADYIDTAYNPSTAGGSFTQNSAHFSCWNRTNSAQGGFMMGQLSGNHIAPKYADNNAYYRCNDNAEMAGVAIANPIGHHIANRSGASAREGYHNGSSITTSSDASKAVANITVFVLAENSGGSPFLPTTKECAAASAGGSLSGTEASDFYNALQTYMTAVGA